MARSILAVLIGFVLIAGLSLGADAILLNLMPAAFTPGGRLDDPAMLTLTLAYVFVFAVFGCYLTAVIAKRRPLLHAMVLATIGLVLNVLGTAIRWQMAPAWYHIVALALVLPAGWIGGALGDRHLARRRAIAQ